MRAMKHRKTNLQMPQQNERCGFHLLQSPVSANPVLPWLNASALWAPSLIVMVLCARKYTVLFSKLFAIH
jgi:hypothetical protein